MPGGGPTIMIDGTPVPN